MFQGSTMKAIYLGSIRNNSHILVIGLIYKVKFIKNGIHTYHKFSGMYEIKVPGKTRIHFGTEVFKKEFKILP